MPRPAHRGGRVHRHHLAGYKPVEQVAYGCELLLHAGRETWCVRPSIQVGTCMGCTSASDVRPTPSHQDRNSPTARA